MVRAAVVRGSVLPAPHVAGPAVVGAAPRPGPLVAEVSEGAVGVLAVEQGHDTDVGRADLDGHLPVVVAVGVDDVPGAGRLHLGRDQAGEDVAE
jgi:hypothetical protein